MKIKDFYLVGSWGKETEPPGLGFGIKSWVRGVNPSDSRVGHLGSRWIVFGVKWGKVVFDE
jgi:hypothetical protein